MGLIKKRSRSETKILIKKIFGVFFITLGILGLFLPFLQGILFIAIGIALYENKSVKDMKKYSKRITEKIKKIWNRKVFKL